MTPTAINDQQSTLSVAVIQYDIPWCDPAQAISYLDLKVNELSTTTDLVVLPEMWPTGFVMEAHDVAQSMDGPAVHAMQKWASIIDGAVAGSIVIQENGHYFNRLVLVSNTEVIGYYDKHHLFGLAGEDQAYTSGTDRVIWTFRGWKICPLICYDLRFPVWSRNYDDYDVLLYVASWPRMRHHAWESLLIARAIENQCYVIGCNRIGKDGNGYPYKGGSTVIDCKGKTLVHAGSEAKTIYSSLSLKAMYRYRTDFPFLADMDRP